MLKNQAPTDSNPVSLQDPPAPPGPLAEAGRHPTPIAAALRLFGSIFYREVDERLLRQVVARREELVQVLGADPLAGLDLHNTAATVEALAVEYCRLFIGPHGHMPPVESVALGEDRFWGVSTEAVAEFYQRCGITLRPDEKAFPDHIAMELDCLAVLAEDDRQADAMVFAREHLLRWVPALLRHVASRATLAFYPTWLSGLHALLEDMYAEGVPGHVTGLEELL